MSALTASLNTPQPAPTEGEGPEMWPLLIASLGVSDLVRNDMSERHDAGVEKYGTPLRAWNGRDCMADAYQEALDLVVYLAQAKHRLRRVLREQDYLLSGADGELDGALVVARARTERALDQLVDVSSVLLKSLPELRKVAVLGVVPVQRPEEVKP